MANNGSAKRQYHDKDSVYAVPNDAIEHDRLDAQAVAIAEMIGGTPFLGLDHINASADKMVDVGCGTGAATVQMAAMFPSATVYGMDLSRVPEAVVRSAPANILWMESNILDVDYSKPSGYVVDDGLFAPGGLDYFFGRLLFMGIDDWPKFFSVAAKLLKSGGIIEHQDLDWSLYRVGMSECPISDPEWRRAMLSAVQHSGLSTHAGSDAASHMKNAGLPVISVQTFEFSHMPSDKTPDSRAVGRYVQSKIKPHVPQLLRKILKRQGIADEKIEVLAKECIRDYSSEEGLHQKYTVTVARKT